MSFGSRVSELRMMLSSCPSGWSFPPRENVHEALEELELVTIGSFDCTYGLGCKTPLEVGIT